MDTFRRSKPSSRHTLARRSKQGWHQHANGTPGRSCRRTTMWCIRCLRLSNQWMLRRKQNRLLSGQRWRSSAARPDRGCSRTTMSCTRSSNRQTQQRKHNWWLSPPRSGRHDMSCTWLGSGHPSSLVCLPQHRSKQPSGHIWSRPTRVGIRLPVAAHGLFSRSHCMLRHPQRLLRQWAASASGWRRKHEPGRWLFCSRPQWLCRHQPSSSKTI